MAVPDASARPHDDPGLQPERTVLAWARTMLSMFIVSAVFLRWLPHYGAWMLALTGVSAAAAVGIYASQRRRYRAQSRGIAAELVHADAAAVLWTTAAMAVLGVLAIAVIATV